MKAKERLFNGHSNSITMYWICLGKSRDAKMYECSDSRMQRLIVPEPMAYQSVGYTPESNVRFYSTPIQRSREAKAIHIVYFFNISVSTIVV